MKKRDVVLDFTSLLDVIMIILFVVIASTNQAVSDANKEVQNQAEEYASVKNDLEDLNEKLNSSNEEIQELLSLNQELQNMNEELKSENNQLQAQVSKTGIDEADLFERLMNKSDKLTLICSPYVKDTDDNETAVEIKILYSKGNQIQEEVNSVVITHNFNLKSDERKKKNAEMQENLYRALKDTVSESESELLLVSLQYTYNDKNFSQADLDIISSAIDDIERRLSRKCYLDKVKQ